MRAAALAAATGLALLPWSTFTGRGIVLALASGALTSGLGYVIWYRALQGLAATTAASVQLSVPVLATLGAHGAVLVTASGAWHATPPPTEVVSTVGAGDSSLFGYLFGDIRQRTPAQRLALAVAYGSAAAGLPGTTIPHPSQVRPELVSVLEDKGYGWIKEEVEATA